MTTIELIESIVCTYENISPELLQQRTRAKKIKETRQIVMYLSCNNKVTELEAGKYYQQIASTAHHAKVVIAGLREFDKSLNDKLCYYEHKINQLTVVRSKIDYYTRLIEPITTEIKETEDRLANLKKVANDLKEEFEKIVMM
jgi:DNA repair ATPase RecN